MKRSLFRFAVMSLLMILISAVQALSLVSYQIVSVARNGFSAIARFAFNVVAGPVPMVTSPEIKPTGGYVAAAAFVQRLIKRERPTVSASWRMCPSI